MLSECTFCAIRDEEVEASIVHRDGNVLAFLDNRPLFEGHVLLTPQQHVADLLTCHEELAAHLMLAAQRMARAVKTATACDGIFMAVNNTVSQSVPHLHIHIVPRRFKDGLRGFMWPRKKYEDPAEAAALAERIGMTFRSEEG